MRLTPPLSLKRAQVEPSGEFAGYGSVFDVVDSYGEATGRGCFADTLAEHRSAGTAPAMLWAHRTDEPVGKWQVVREDDRGLYVEGKLTLDVPRARDAHALLKDGALGLSIGFVPVDDHYDSKRRVLVLDRVKLFEVSLVAMPANPAATVTAVKSVRDLETVLRDAGFSRREATRIAAGGFRALANEPSDELRDVAELLRRRAAELNSFRG